MRMRFLNTLALTISLAHGCAPFPDEVSAEPIEGDHDAGSENEAWADEQDDAGPDGPGPHDGHAPESVASVSMAPGKQAPGALTPVQVIADLEDWRPELPDLRELRANKRPLYIPARRDEGLGLESP